MKVRDARLVRKYCDVSGGLEEEIEQQQQQTWPHAKKVHRLLKKYGKNNQNLPLTRLSLCSIANRASSCWATDVWDATTKLHKRSIELITHGRGVLQKVWHNLGRATVGLGFAYTVWKMPMILIGGVITDPVQTIGVIDQVIEKIAWAFAWIGHIILHCALRLLAFTMFLPFMAARYLIFPKAIYRKYHIILKNANDIEAELNARGVEIPDEFIDPVTRELMIDPVLTTDFIAGEPVGIRHAYDRKSIQAWLNTRLTDPYTNLRLRSSRVDIDRVTRASLRNFITTHISTDHLDSSLPFLSDS